MFHGVDAACEATLLTAFRGPHLRHSAPTRRTIEGPAPAVPMPTSAPLQPADLAQVPLFADLSPEQHQRLLEQHRTVSFQADQQLVLEQDESQGLFLLRSGLTKVRTFTADGSEAVLGLLGPGDVLGEMAVLEMGGRRTADVVCLLACTAVMLRAGPFRGLLASEPRLALALARLEANRLQNLNRRFCQQSGDATTRVLAALADLACHTATGAAATAPIPPLPQSELAILCGLARETTSRTLSKLRQKGTIIDTEDGGIKLADLTPLRRRGLL